MQDNPNYSYIGTVKTPDGQTHYYKDAEARAAVTAIEERVDLAEAGGIKPDIEAHNTEKNTNVQLNAAITALK